MIDLTDRQLRSVQLMLKTGYSRKAVMARFDLTESQVKTLIRRLRTSPVVVPPPWTPDQDAVALELARKKLPYVAIGTRLGRTKSAVAGRVSRLRRKESA